MRPIVLLAAGALLVACGKGNDREADDTASALGADSAPAGAAVSGGAAGATLPDTAGGHNAAGDTGAAASGAAAGGAAGGARAAGDSANQSQSGVTDTKTGASTLGPNVTKTRPDQGQATTSKGDTVRPKGAQPPR